MQDDIHVAVHLWPKSGMKRERDMCGQAFQVVLLLLLSLSMLL